MFLDEDKLKTLKDTIQNKFAELDFREEDVHYVCNALVNIARELHDKHCGKHEESEKDILKEIMKALGLGVEI